MTWLLVGLVALLLMAWGLIVWLVWFIGRQDLQWRVVVDSQAKKISWLEHDLKLVGTQLASRRAGN